MEASKARRRMGSSYGGVSGIGGYEGLGCVASPPLAGEDLQVGGDNENRPIADRRIWRPGGLVRWIEGV